MKTNPTDQTSLASPAVLSAVALCSLVAGCASAPQTYPALDAARTEVEAARASPDAAMYAQLQLHKADELLQSAQQAAQAHKGDAVDYYSYLATQNSRLALAIGNGKAADAHVAQGDVERQQIELAARTREVEAARAEAQTASARAQAAEAQQQAQQQQFQAELAKLQAQQTARGTVITLKDVLFATGKSQLQPGAELTLDQIATALKDAPDRALDIEGFTDTVGSEGYNQTLSEARADAVRQALVARGIDASRITTHGYGEQYPVASNATDAGRQLNRRVEIVLANDNGSVPPRQSLTSQR
jgi:outer membrane protein OmpA-like peptidoglycan-associated protein